MTLRHGIVATLLALVVAAPLARAQDSAGTPFGKSRISFTSGALKLEGFLYRPEGTGPHPAVLWNHGSEQHPDRLPQFDAVARVFVPAGYVVFAPVRRGHGDSEGTYIQFALRGQSAERRNTLQVDLLAGEQLDDQLAGLAYLKGLPYVDSGRIAVAGCSYGGILALLGAERGAGYRAAVAISPAAQSWDLNPVLRDRLVAAVRAISIPVFLLQPPRDDSLGPSKVLGAEFQRLGKAYQGKVYPADIPAQLQTHCFGGIRRGSMIWAPDVLAFLSTALR